MNEKISVFGLFPIPIYTVANISIPEKIKTQLTKIEYIRFDVNNGWVSDNKYILEDKKFKELKAKITQHINNFVKEVLSISDDVVFEITQSWIVKHSKGDWAQTHQHKNSLYSGVVYLDVEGTTGDIQFHRNNISAISPAMMCFDFKYKEFNSFNSELWKFTPRNGDLFLFPSSTQHSVSINESSKTRYALAFNVFIKGAIGKITGLNHLEL